MNNEKYTDKTDIANPHDAFFKEIFSQKKYVENFIQVALPENIKNKLDFKTLKLDNNSYIDEELKQHDNSGEINPERTSGRDTEGASRRDTGRHAERTPGRDTERHAGRDVAREV